MQRPTDLRRFTGLWRHADFLRLWIGQTISRFGSLVGISAVAFTAILVLEATPFQLGLLSAARLAPGFLTGLAAGAWADRLRRRPILIAADIGRALLLATIPATAAVGLLRIEQLYIVTLLVSVLNVFFDVAYQSYLPSLVSSAELVEGNSKLAATSSVAEFGGFAISGWLVQLFTAPIAILVDAISFVVSAVSLWLIRTPESQPARAEHPNMRREIAEGLSEVMHHPLLRALAACTVSKEFFSGIYGALVVLYMVRDLGFAPAILGCIWALGGVSSLLGAATTKPATTRFGMGATMITGLMIFSLTLFFVPLARGPTVTAALLLILQQIFGDGPATVYEITHVTLRQTIAPERLLGRVNASVVFLALGSTLAGSLLGGVLGETIGVRPTLFLAAFGTLLSSLWLLFSPVRTLHAAPASAMEAKA